MVGTRDGFKLRLGETGEMTCGDPSNSSHIRQLQHLNSRRRSRGPSTGKGNNDDNDGGSLDKPQGENNDSGAGDRYNKSRTLLCGTPRQFLLQDEGLRSHNKSQ